MTRHIRRVVGAVLVSLVCAASADAQTTASVTGTVTTRGGAIVLAGVTVSLVDQSARQDTPGRGQPILTATTNGAGRFAFASIAPGEYRLRATFLAFEPAERSVTVAAGAAVDASLDLNLSVAATVDAEVVRDTDGQGSALDGRLFDVAPVRGDALFDLLPVLPGVVRSLDGKLVVNGGRPAETGLSVDSVAVMDPVTGDAGISLPLDAIAAVDVESSPYAAEHGRFTAGVIRVTTRAGGDRWRATASNFVPAPCAKLCASDVWGVRNFSPRVSVSGPIVPGRLAVAQSLQYHHKRERVLGLPVDQADTTLEALDSFTRLDATVGSHVLTTSAAISPRNLGFVGLDTFHRRDVAPHLTQRRASVSVVDAWRLSPTAVLESTVGGQWQRTATAPTRFGSLVITPSGTENAFFNRSTRKAMTTSWTEAVTFVRTGAGEHVFKVGADVIRTTFDGTSESAPVEVRDAAGRLRERLVFGGPVTLAAGAVDLALFAEDRWRPSDRAVVAVGLRWDRDGVSGDAGISPRVQLTVGLDREGRTIVRAGLGRFIARTPLLAAVFPSIETPAIARVVEDGTLVRREARYQTADLRPERARVWNVGVDRRVSDSMTVRVNLLARDSSQGAIVDVVDHGDSAVVFTLASAGRSTYREAEAVWRYSDTGGREVSVSYVRSRAEGDLNRFADYFGPVRQPLVRANAYGRTDTDVPNRLMIFGVVPVGAWRVSPVVEVRSGFPYSAVDADQQFVEPRNGLRFPTFWSADLSVSRAVRVRGRQVRVGLRANHVFDNDAPLDVQRNIASPAFGAFTNSLYRRVAVTVSVDR